MIISPLYIALIVATLVIGFGATAYVNSQLKKYTKVPSSRNITGAETARRMLAANGVTGVTLREGSAGQDHFDPRDNSITLDPEAYHGTSITAIATACHEVGHAIQFAQ
ncbi:MAG: zinc metallopeptidase, partial [Raoultibacter sp.]